MTPAYTLTPADQARYALSVAESQLLSAVDELRRAEAELRQAATRSMHGAKFAQAGRPLAVAITNAETALLWLGKTQSDVQGP